MAPQSPRHGVPATPARRPRPARFVRPRCEPLEGRFAPALFNVQAPLTFTGLNNNGSVATADLNKDGFTDAVLTNFGSDHAAGAGTTITALYGRAGGGFNRVQLNTGGTNVSFVSIADINGDTWPDVVAVNANKQETGSFSVFRNTGGTPQTSALTMDDRPAFSTFGNNSSWVGLAEVTGDTVLDVIVASFGKDDGNDNVVGQKVTIFQGNADAQGKGNFTYSSSPTTLAPGIQFIPTALAVADFDLDGKQDIAAAVPGVPPDFGVPQVEGVVYVFKGNGSGGFAQPSQYGSGGALPVNIQAADLNGDGKPDLVVANAGDPNATPEFNDDSVGVLLNISSGGSLNFGIPNSLTANTHGTFAVAVADFDLDGKQDIAAVNYGSVLDQPSAFVAVYKGNGSGAFTPDTPGTYDTQTGFGGGQYLAVGNFDANPSPDLIVAHASNRVGVLLNTSSTGPTVTINQGAGQADPTNGSAAVFDVAFSEAVTGFAAADISFTGSTVGGTLVAAVSGTGPTYQVTVTGMTGAGTVRASIPAGAATSVAGSVATAASTSTDNQVTFDLVAPTVTINQSPGQADPTTSGPISFTVVFSEPVAGFGSGDVDLSGSSLSGLSAAVTQNTPSMYTVSVTGMAGNGTVVARVVAGAAADAAGNASAASTSTDNSVTFGAAAVPVTINQSAVQTDPTNKSPITYVVRFNEAVTGFDGSDVLFAGSSVGGTLAAAVSGSGQDYTVTVTGMTGTGTVVASVSADAAVNGTGTANAASTSTDNTVMFDAASPAVTIDQAGGQADPTIVASVRFAVRFSEPVTAFGPADVSLAGSTAGGSLSAAVTGSLDTYIVTVTGMTSDGLVVASIPAGGATDAAGNTNLASTSTDNSVRFETNGTLGFSEAIYNTTEDGTAVTITVTRSGSTGGRVTIDFATADDTARTDGTAAAGRADYTPDIRTLTWENGQGGNRTFTIPILPDTRNEGRETIKLALTNPDGNPSLGLTEATVVIAPSDGKEIKASAKVPTGVFFDAGGLDGDRVVVRLAGRVGTATVYLTDTDGDGYGPIEWIDLADTLPTRSVLTVSVAKPRGGTGDGRTRLAEVTGSGLRALNALTTDLNGPGVNLAGYLGMLRIGNISGGADVTMGAPPPTMLRPSVRITAGVIANGTDVTTPVRLAYLTAIAVGDGTITAPSVGALVARGKLATRTALPIVGNFNSDVLVNVGGVAPLGLALTRLRAAGSIASDVIDVAGNVGTISVGVGRVGDLTGTDIKVSGHLNAVRVAGKVNQVTIDARGNVRAVVVGSFWNSRLDAGYSGTDDGEGTYDLPSFVGTFRVTALTNGFQSSNVIATNINSVVLASVNPVNPAAPGTRFGFTADKALRALVVTSPVQRFVFNPLAASPQTVPVLGLFEARDRDGPG